MRIHTCVKPGDSLIHLCNADAGPPLNEVSIDGTGVCSSINARPEASVSCGITNDIDSTIVSSGRSSNESQQLFGLDNLAAAVSSPSLCTSLVFLGVLAALAAQGGAAHAADSADSVMTHHHSAQAVFGASFSHTGRKSTTVCTRHT